MNVFCPKHPQELLRSVFYTIVSIPKDKRKSENSKWFFCKICEKLYKPKVTFK